MLRLTRTMVLPAALLLAACGGSFEGKFQGEAVESGTLKIAVAQTGAEAKNETPPRKLPNQTVTVHKAESGWTVKFGACELKGEESGAKLLVLKGSPCEVKVATYEGPLPLSGTLELEGDGAKLNVTATVNNGSAVVSYEYAFTGKRAAE